MSEFHYIQMPPDGTGKRSSQLATLEIHYDTAVDAFALGDTVTTDTGFEGEVVKVEENNPLSGEIYCRCNHGSTTTIPDNTDLKVDTVAIAKSNGTTSVFYTQETVLTGGNNPFNSVSINDSGALNTTFATGDPTFDAFGKLGTSETTVIREYLPIYDKLPDDFTDTYTGTADIEWNDTRKVVEFSVGTDSGDKCIRRSNIHHKYQTGIGTTVLWSAFAGDAGKAGVTRRMGFFDDTDGLFFQMDEGGIEVVVRSSTSGGIVESHVKQEDWSHDRLDGAGGSFNISGKTLNPTKAQVMFIDFQWLGVGRVRFGFVIDGQYIIAHEFNHANIVNNPYMRSGSLPISFEMENTTGTASPSYMYVISSAVKCEGKYEPRKFLESGSLPPAVNVPSASQDEYTFIGAVRPVEYIAIGDESTTSITDGVFAYTVPSASPTDSGTFTSVLTDLSAIFSEGDYIIFEGTTNNNGVIHIIKTVTANTLTFTPDGPPIYDEGDINPVTCDIIKKSLTPNRAIGEIKDITLMNVSHDPDAPVPLLVELVKNAGISGATSGILTVTTNTAGTNYIHDELCDLTIGTNGRGAVCQVKTIDGNPGAIDSVHIVVGGEDYLGTETGVTIVGRQSGQSDGTIDITGAGALSFSWVDAYPGNMLDAAKPSTGAYHADLVTSTVYTTLMTDRVQLDLREHFEKDTELMFRKADLTLAPDDWTIRVRPFNSGSADVAFAISWWEIRT